LSLDASLPGVLSSYIQPLKYRPTAGQLGYSYIFRLHNGSRRCPARYRRSRVGDERGDCFARGPLVLEQKRGGSRRCFLSRQCRNRVLRVRSSYRGRTFQGGHGGSNSVIPLLAAHVVNARTPQTADLGGAPCAPAYEYLDLVGAGGLYRRVAGIG
jgi:hypothetical protein